MSAGTMGSEVNMGSFFRLLGAAAVLALAACTPPATTTTTPIGGGGPSTKIYKIRASDEDAIQLRMLDSVNSLRQAAGAPALQMDARLNAAAKTHSRDMSVQNRPWHFGSDGSSPLDRVVRTGYEGQLIGENISETYETELETLAAWMQDADTRRVILDNRARRMGFEWYQERNGKIWWTLVTGS